MKNQISFLLGLAVFSLTVSAHPARARAEAPESARGGHAMSLGMERLFTPSYLPLIQGKRLGVLAHHASRNHEGRHLVDLLHERKDLDLKVIFAPEHGFRSTDDDLLPDSIDAATGLPVYSLYGPRRAPTPELLAGIDVLLIDLQDVGVRYYTYSATMELAMEAAAASHKKVIVLDRPNPIGGARVEGAVQLTDLHKDIAAFSPIASRHGMTLGELAVFLNDVFSVHADLTVVRMEGWSRADDWAATGLPWTPPSPALPKADQAELYGVFGTLEAVNIAVGRGKTNDEAFRVYGAPWISVEQANQLVTRLNALRLPGLRFSQVEWTPSRREYEGKLCRGFGVEMTDAAKIRGFESLLRVMRTMKEVLGNSVDLAQTDGMLGAKWLRTGLEKGIPVEKLMKRAADESQEFLSLRRKALLY